MNPDQEKRALFNEMLEETQIPAYLSHFAEIAFNAVIALDSERRITYWNPAAERLYGWTANEALGQSFEELFKHRLDLNEHKNLLEKLVKTARGEIVRGEYNFRHKNGAVLSIEYVARVISEEEDSLSGYLIIHRDITASKQADEKIGRLNTVLQTQLDEHNSLMEILPIAIWTGNHDCSVITGNPAAYRTMGLPQGINVSLSTPAPELPFGLRIFIDGVEVDPENAPMQTVARTGKPLHNIEHEFLFPDQTRKIFFASIAPVFDEHGVVRKVIAAYVDFTERKLAEEQLRLAREYAEQTAERLARLQKVTAALSEAATPPQVAEVLVEQGAPALGASSSTIMLITEDGEWLETVQTAAPEALIRPYKRFSLSLNVPAADAVRSGQPVWLESRQQYLERYPHLSDQIIAWGKQAAIAVPMVVKEHILGVLTLSFDQVIPETAENLGFALTIARQGAQALERARLYRETQQALSELQITYDQSPIGMIQLDTDLRYMRVNETLTRYNNLPASAHIGRSIYEVVPDLAPKLEKGFQQVIETGEPVYNIEMVGETKADPNVQHTWLESWYPLRDDTGKVIGLNIVVQDITDRKRDEQTLAEFARQQESLYQLTDRLHRTSTLSGAFDAALDAILNALQCDRAAILLFDETGVMRFVAWRGLSFAYRTATEGHSPWEAHTIDPQLVYFNDVDAAELDDALKAAVRTEGIASLAFIPLVFDGNLIGKFMMYFDTPHTFDAGELDFSLTVAHQLAVGIHRTRSEEALRESEAKLAADLKDTKQLQKISSLLIQEDNIELLYEEILNGAMILMDADIGSMQMLDNEKNELILLVWKGFTPEAAAFWGRVNLASSSSCGAALRSGERVIVPDVEASDFIAGSQDLEIYRLSGIRAVQTTPLVSRSGRVVGMISTHWREPHQPEERDLRMLDVLARQAADLIERRRAEYALRASEQQLQLLNESLEQKVREQTAEVRKLASDLTKAEQRERHRIAHILHEDLQQRIYAIQMQIEFIGDGLGNASLDLQSEFDRIKRQLSDVVALTRHLSVDLSPPILRDEGLPQAVSWLASQMDEQHGFHIDLKVGPAFATSSEDIRMLLFSCIRELLFNVVKHAGVNRAEVVLMKQNRDLVIQVRDKGKGFNVSALEASTDIPVGEAGERNLHSRSFGLPTIRHRLSLFGGQLDVRSHPDEGTQVTITMPDPE